ncbi:hypothetical protein AURANDRAFT_68310 [Aureococcus anophagefferens]|uniref:Uncharacterized protein n=1 Tax=Aureococcus anophagefferens TaxID=44056 RepID=F0YP74_AURAN|nr:hypothetical protein AURANDRAFT_68310 [Aureococcus anophagefferens]EGB03085.1 hypothetical protein AURANDRAFT_68310 [Aureococcus anophagefferens]|eukprot:XP_009042222.1 hypothetical protein AURANDRAFT_68310 [Aureococcus anophagefferens]
MEWYDGVVKSLYSKSKWFLIVYTDDDKEEVTEKELQRILVPPVPGALGAIAASSLLPAVGAYGGAAAVGKLRLACRALSAFDWAPVWAALVEARFPFAGQRDVEAYRRTDAENPLFFRPSATSVSYADLNDDGPAFLAGAAAGTRWARGDVLTRSRRRFRVAFGAVLGAGRAYVGLAVARAFDGGAATLDSDDAILISSHGYISRATGGGADGLPNRWGPGPDGWVDVQVDLDTHYVSIASSSMSRWRDKIVPSWKSAGVDAYTYMWAGYLPLGADKNMPKTTTICTRITTDIRAVGSRLFAVPGGHTVREATITGLESIKKGEGYWVTLHAEKKMTALNPVVFGFA